VVFCALLLSVSSPLAGQRETVTHEDEIGWLVRVEGQISASDDGRPVAGATVRLESGDGDLIGTTNSSLTGRFDFTDLRPINYRLKITAAGYQPYEDSVDLNGSAVHTVLNIVLRPNGKGGLEPPASRTDATAPKSARKEYEKGVRAVAENKLDAAQAHLQNAVAEYPCYARAQTLLAMTFIRQRSANQAEAALREAIHCDPDFVKGYLDLGELLNQEKRYRESGAVLQEGLRRLPGAWKFYYQLGIADSGLGDWGKAEQDFLKALALTPPPPADTHVRLADVYLRENASDKAFAQMVEYLRLEPEGRFAPRVRDFMRRMQANGAVQTPPSTTSTPKPNF